MGNKLALRDRGRGRGRDTDRDQAGDGDGERDKDGGMGRGRGRLGDLMAVWIASQSAWASGEIHRRGPALSSKPCSSPQP